jgi:CDP-diacylglycerol--glycerol-3-phosphate 3-phosphatidyltransferase
MTTANKITIGRIVLVPCFIVALVAYAENGEDFYRWLAIGFFSVAAIGDGVDGWVARHFNQRTEMGALLDPLADKLLLVLGLVILSLDNGPQLDRIPLWLTATVLCRDVMLLLLMVLVNFLVGKGSVRPRMTGKIATVFQMSCVLWALLKWDTHWLFILAVATTATTAISGLLYLRDGIGMMRHRRPAGEPAAKPPVSKSGGGSDQPNSGSG